MATDAVRSPSSAEAIARAERLAEAEGLTLIPSTNTSGYKGVSKAHHVRGYLTRVRENSADVHLGCFETAAEGALAYARYLGPDRCAQEAQKRLRAGGSNPNIHRQFGVPRLLPSANTERQESGVDEVTIVESVLVESHEHGDHEDDITNAPASVQTLQEPNHGAAVTAAHGDCESSTSEACSFKRKRIAQTLTDEYELTTSQHSAGKLTVPVPTGAVRATITFHFA